MLVNHRLAELALLDRTIAVEVVAARAVARDECCKDADIDALVDELHGAVAKKHIAASLMECERLASSLSPVERSIGVGLAGHVVAVRAVEERTGNHRAG